MSSQRYDLIVIGSGPAGQKGAIAAAKLGKDVAIIDREKTVGGVRLHGGTVPSKTLREAILHLTGLRQKSFYGADYAVKDRISISDLQRRILTVIEREMAVMRGQFRRNGVALISGTARFADPHTLEVEGASGTQTLTAGHVLIACGTRPVRHPDIPFDGERIAVVDDTMRWTDIPRTLIVVGAGVIGLELASMFSALSVPVTLIEQRPTLLDFVDGEIVEALSYQMRSQGTTFRLGEKVAGVRREDNGRVVAHLDSGKVVHADSLVYAVGRQCNTDLLDLGKAGLTADSRGRLDVSDSYQTEVPHIYAAGDVIGFPALASTSMEQGRLASCHMFGRPGKIVAELLPYGIYTIPEISMVGQTERQLTEHRIPYEVGTAKYEEVSRGQIVGDQSGLLKILFHLDTRAVLGVHALGEGATEMIHIGQAVLALGGTVEYFRDTVFNYPTFAEAYKVAAMNGLNKL
jgi:NAD(P) transhydrogenase